MIDTSQITGFSIDGFHTQHGEDIEELMPWQWVIVFEDCEDFRENFAEVREQLLCDAEGYEWNP